MKESKKVLRMGNVRMEQIWLPAAYTVEAAFVIPIILGILFALIYFVYYEHDKIVLQGNIEEAVIRLVRNKEKVPDRTEWKKQIQKNLWMAQVEEGSISENSFRMKAFGMANMSLDIPVMKYFLAGQQSCSYTMQVQTWQPEQVIRWKGILPEASP